ncbi:MAG: hypothetical protein WBM86_29600, partial [Waterburya sp.]
QPYQAWQVKEGDLAIAYKGDKNQPEAQVVVRIGKQYRLTKERINDPQFQIKWAEREKHDPQTLPNLFAEKAKAGKEIWGMTFEPLGDLVDGQLLDFQTGKIVNLATFKTNPLTQIKPANEKVAFHMQKDLAMSEIATQFIGYPVQFDGQSSTEKYLDAWGDRANTGVYSSNDIVMISGNGPWRASAQELQNVFKQQYVPLLDKAIAANALLMVGSAKGTDLLVQDYLKSQGYSLEKTPNDYVKASAITQDLSKSIQHLGTLEQDTQAAIIKHLSQMKSSLNTDVSHESRALLNAPSQLVQTQVLASVIDDSLKLKPVSKPVPIKTNTQSVAMISIPNVEQMVGDYDVARTNLGAAQQTELKNKVKDVLSVAGKSVKLLDTVKVWQTGADQVRNSNSLIANFSDPPSQEELKYRAALIGRETGQKALVTFREDVQGEDALISLNVPNHHDEYAIRAKLGEMGIKNYSVIPTAKFTKIVLSDRGGANLPIAKEIAKHYETTLRITQGTATVVPERDFNPIIETFETAN